MSINVSFALETEIIKKSIHGYILRFQEDSMNFLEK